MKTHQEHPCTSLVFYGVRRGVGTTTLAVNVATLLGIVARRRTLLLDLGGNEVRASTYLGVSDERGLLGLMTPFLKRGRISAEELAMQTVRYEPGAPWDRSVSQLDILCGFDRAHLSDAEREGLCADREAFLVAAVHKSACSADYEFVIADGGTCSLANYETLCWRCHPQATRERH